MNKAFDYVEQMILRRKEVLQNKRDRLKERYPVDMYGTRWMDKAGPIEDELIQLDRIHYDLRNSSKRADLYEQQLRSAQAMNRDLKRELDKYDPYTVQTLERRYGRSN